MTTFSLAALTDAVIAFKKGITLQQGRQLRDNLLAAFEGDATAIAAGVTLKDLALDTGAATAEGIAWVGLRTAGLAVGAVGSYAMLSQITPTISSAGSTHAGSGLLYSNANASVPTGSPSGTWRLMGRTRDNNQTAATSLFLRIS